ncbi:PREDICTED: uncharacterized protein LOC108619010 [Drosophila arizonae]|uniref:Uncharacterized protein LOC108619010 n=1 Tax=Drosophila arizonae TaxID=7263 RepID=A0ABM1PU94_DROAR|nr:PREDICTED: uncharacterized protein LOC108619010 [Drosophila arizonae]
MTFNYTSSDEEDMILDIELLSSSDDSSVEVIMDAVEGELVQQQQQEAPLEVDLVSDSDEMDALESESEDVDFSSIDEDDLIEHVPEDPTMEEAYESIDMGLAVLDGIAQLEHLDELTQAAQMEHIKEVCLQQLSGASNTSNEWAVIAPLHTSSVVNVLRLCFGRINRNEYRIYDATNGNGYCPIPGPPLVIEGLSTKPSGQLEPLLDGLALTETYVHLFPYSSLSEYVKQMIQEETGADIPELLNNADSKMGIELLPDAEMNIMCAGRGDRVGIHFRSCTQSKEQQMLNEENSGTNIFGEPTVVSMIIAKTEVVLSNQQIQLLAQNPESNIYLYADSSCIYVLNGRILFETTELTQHILPISNIDLIPFSPSEPISIDSDPDDE